MPNPKDPFATHMWGTAAQVEVRGDALIINPASPPAPLAQINVRSPRCWRFFLYTRVLSFNLPTALDLNVVFGATFGVGRANTAKFTLGFHSIANGQIYIGSQAFTHTLNTSPNAVSNGFATQVDPVAFNTYPWSDTFPAQSITAEVFGQFNNGTATPDDRVLLECSAFFAPIDGRIGDE